MDGAKVQERSVAEAFMCSLKWRGIDYVLANAGTDFAPVIEGLVSLAGKGEAAPQFLTIPHENLAVAMAHVGKVMSRKARDARAKQMRLAIFFTLATLAMLAAIPWPGMANGRPLFRF